MSELEKTSSKDLISCDRTRLLPPPSQLAPCASTLLPPPHPPPPRLTWSLHLPLSISTGWQDGTQERRPRGGKWQPYDSVSGRVESYIYPLPEGHSKRSHTAHTQTHTHTRISEALLHKRTDMDGLKWKVSEMSLHVFFFLLKPPPQRFYTWRCSHRRLRQWNALGGA